jgi:hypothetical protein
MTDGTPASIAQKIALVQSYNGNANLTWLDFALKSILGGEYAQNDLPATVPGMINPLVYWTSSNLQSYDRSLLAPGIETLLVIIMRAGIQRTYGKNGNTCERTTILQTSCAIKMESYGIYSATIFLVIQTIFAVLSILCFIPWLMSENPIGPAVRAVRQSVYFTTLLADSNFSDNIRGLCNAPGFAIWQGLDVVVQVGESIKSVQDDIGHITMDKKKFVRELVNGRRYT